MDGINKVTKGTTTMHSSSVDHRRIQKSSTLNRKFVKKPVARPKINAAAGAASRSLRRQGQRREPLIDKQNTVKLQPIQAEPAQAASRQESVRVATKAQSTQQQGAQRVAIRQPRIGGVIGGKQSGRQQVAKQAVAAKQVAVKQTQTTQGQQQRPVTMRKQIISDTQDTPAQKNRAVEAAKARIASRKAAAEPEHLSAQELKERAIQQALRKVDRIEGDKDMSAQFVGESRSQKAHFWQKRGFAIAAGMAVISLALLGYLVSLNLPDISVRVTAMQTGIEKIYPNYLPNNYRLDGLVKEENGRVTMNFKNDEGKKFIMMEEKSNWDSAAVLANYVKKNWGNNYSIAKGQGLTIYVSGSNAAWVNGGVFYVISDESGSLSSTDLHDIAVSL